MKAERVVVDTNVLISAALSANAAPAKLLQHLLQHARLIFSPETFTELETRLWRPKFDRYLSIETRQLLLHDFNAVAEWVSLEGQEAITSVRHSRDADDDKFIHTALIANADVIVSGDQDLLLLQTIGTLHIVTPADLLANIGT
ncbi:putative toxin-antitoxin system toxin component, PIN family [Viridibacterium curvum]|uniref:Toxin-antitoxin system toxin component, PIN family n=1 Tax=Viridibacterium curvum TaxID=1101404 RepID=A0ABP9R7E8_9RHOO